MKKTILLILTLILFILSFAEKVPIPELNSPITDLTGTLSKSQLKNIKNKLILFEKSNNEQIAVLLVPTTGKESIEEYSISLAENWKIGSAENDDGIILLIAKNDRKLRIEVGYGLEATVTDAEAQYIIDNLIIPQFKKGQFYKGINNGIDRIIGLIIGISPPITEIKKNTKHKSSFWESLAIILGLLSVFAYIVPWFLLKKSFKTMFIVVLLILITATCSGLLMDANSNSRFILTALAGVFTAIPLLINLIGTLTGKKKNWNFSSGGSSSGWSSSSTSSYSSSSSSSSYSGGGGSFGGGGASGSW